MQPRVENEQRRVRLGNTDRHRGRVGVRHRVRGHRHRCLGRPVQVVQFGRPVPLAELLCGGRRQCLTDRQHSPQARRHLARGDGAEHGQHRRHQVQCRHRLCANQIQQVVGVAMTVGRGHDEPPAGGQLRPELPHRQVERGCGLEQRCVGLVECVLRTQPVQLVDDGTVRDRNALRPTGRPGREDDVRGVGCGEHPGAFGRVHRSTRVGIGVEPGQIHDRSSIGDLGTHIAGDQNARGSGCLEDRRVALGRLVGIDRNVRPACCRDGVHADEEIDRAPNGKADRHFRPDTHADQVTRELRDPLGELSVRHHAVVVDECDCSAVAFGGCTEQIGQSRPFDGTEIVNRVVPVLDDRRSLAVQQHIEIADGCRRRRHDGGQHGLEAGHE
ncbi:unannotated protein [freshwater metagenome]|uniref:Unannotated protein n=1 Tax=freshwater metagenome TaxID=449393 RepID=A0A6J7IN26_9ZZZZ